MSEEERQHTGNFDYVRLCPPHFAFVEVQTRGDGWGEGEEEDVFEVQVVMRQFHFLLRDKKTPNYLKGCEIYIFIRIELKSNVKVSMKMKNTPPPETNTPSTSSIARPLASRRAMCSVLAPTHNTYNCPRVREMRGRDGKAKESGCVASQWAEVKTE